MKRRVGERGREKERVRTRFFKSPPPSRVSLECVAFTVWSGPMGWRLGVGWGGRRG